MKCASMNIMRNPFDWSSKNVLVTGGTGSFGRKFIQTMLADYHPRRLVVFSRDELKQHEMRTAGFEHPSLRYFIGDVRDEKRLRRAFEGVDIVVHAAALKQVPACEYNPLEAISTNIDGARHIIDAALDANVPRVLALSTDKAVNPANLYGATKLAAEKLFTQSNAYAGKNHSTRFSSVRYGNVVGSRGSVIPLFREQMKTGQITITDPRMTRFWLTLEQGVAFVVSCIESMQGGEIFVPKIPSMNILDLATAIAPGCEQQTVGIRPGEKLHEMLIADHEARYTRELQDMFVIVPSTHTWWRDDHWQSQGQILSESFTYSSDNNTQWLGVTDLQALLATGG